MLTPVWGFLWLLCTWLVSLPRMFVSKCRIVTLSAPIPRIRLGERKFPQQHTAGKVTPVLSQSGLLTDSDAEWFSVCFVFSLPGPESRFELILRSLARDFLFILFQVMCFLVLYMKHFCSCVTIFSRVQCFLLLVLACYFILGMIHCMFSSGLCQRISWLWEQMANGRKTVLLVHLHLLYSWITSYWSITHHRSFWPPALLLVVIPPSHFWS